jgi:hypothetical protein
MWAGELPSQRVQGIGKVTAAEIQHQLGASPPILLYGLRNVWCSSFMARGSPGLINMVRTEIRPANKPMETDARFAPAAHRQVRRAETALKTGIPVLDTEVLSAMQTRALLGRLHRLQRCEESASASNEDPDALARAHGILFKDTLVVSWSGC